MAANAMTTWSGVADESALDMIPDDAMHWLAQPADVWHCGIAAQFGMDSAHEQLAMPPWSVIVASAAPLTLTDCCMPWHDLDIAKAATGENARVRRA